jgi:hypothetical protein
MLERRCGGGTLNHDQIVVLPLEAGRGEVRGAGVQQRPASRAGGRALAGCRREQAPTRGVTIRIRYRILNARLAAGAVSAGQGLRTDGG